MFKRDSTNQEADILAGVRVLSEVIAETFKTSGEKTMVKENPVLTELMLHSLEKAKLLNIFENPCLQGMGFASFSGSASGGSLDAPIRGVTADTLSDGQDTSDVR